MTTKTRTLVEEPEAQEDSSSLQETETNYLVIEDESDELNEQDVTELSEASKEGVQRFYVGPNSFTRRRYWGHLKGRTHWTLDFRNARIKESSHVFVSICEGMEGGMGLIVGGAEFTLNGVAPYNGGVKIKAYIDWHTKLHMSATYLVINP